MRGGRKVRMPPRTGPEALIDFIWERQGGVGEVAKICGIDKQLPIAWRRRGKVPLPIAGYVAKCLDVNMSALNYEDCYFMLVGDVPKWDFLVSCIVPSTDKVNEILALPAPGVSIYDPRI